MSNILKPYRYFFYRVFNFHTHIRTATYTPALNAEFNISFMQMLNISFLSVCCEHKSNNENFDTDNYVFGFVIAFISVTLFNVWIFGWNDIDKAIKIKQEFKDVGRTTNLIADILITVYMIGSVLVFYL